MFRATRFSRLSIGFLGAGAMGSAMAGGLRKSDTFSQYRFSDVNEDALRSIEKAVPGCITTKDTSELVSQSDVIVLAFKPNNLPEAASALKDSIMKRSSGGSGTEDNNTTTTTDTNTSDGMSKQLIVSIMAGVTLGQLQAALGNNVPIIRAMPNTPLLVGRGTTALAANSHVSEEQKNLVNGMFTSLGVCVTVEERLLDAVTGISGSGPAFVAMMIESLTDGGVLCGLPRATAATLAAHTVYGTGALIHEKNIHPALLKDMITSPAGTTISGIQELENGNFRGTVIRAVEATSKRSSELGSSKK